MEGGEVGEEVEVGEGFGLVDHGFWVVGRLRMWRECRWGRWLTMRSPWRLVNSGVPICDFVVTDFVVCKGFEGF